MDAPRSWWTGRAPALLSYLWPAILFALICWAWDATLLRGGKDFWDAHVYAKALHQWGLGANPYLAADGGLPFVYPPIFLKIASVLGPLFPARSGWFFYLALLCAGTFATPWLLATTYIRDRWFSPAIAFFLFALGPKLLSEMTLLSGNLSSLLYALALAAGVLGIRRNRWLPFYLAVVLASLIKPPFLAFLLLPLLAGTGQLWLSLLSAALTAGGYALQRFTMPELFAAFQQGVKTQVVVRQDAGFGIYSFLLKLSGKVSFLRGSGAPIAHLLIIFAVVVALFALRKARHLPATRQLWVPVILVTAILADPRMQAYDANIALLPALYLCVECIRMALAQRVNILWVAVPLAAVMAILSQSAWLAICPFFLGVVLATLFFMRRAVIAAPTAQA